MADFMDYISQVNAAEAARAQREAAGSIGNTRERRMANPRYAQAFAKFFESYTEAVYGGSLRSLKLMREAISTSDFPLLFGDTIDRMLLAQYRYHAPELPFVHNDTMMDFRAAERYQVSIGRGYGNRYGQAEDYRHDRQSEDSYSVNMYKWGGIRNITFEALMNDDLGALKRTPEDFAIQARNTEVVFCTSLWAGNTSLYATNHSAGGTTYSNRYGYALTADSLSYVASQMAKFPGDDDNGAPLDNSPVYIVVGTERMRQRAEQILNSLVVTYTGDADRDNLPTANIIDAQMRSRMRVVLNKWLGKTVNFGGGEADKNLYIADANTSWYLFSDPGTGWAVEMDTLAGYTEPQLFMRASNQVMLGGGMASPMQGSFENDTVGYKWLHFVGGNSTEAAGGWRFTAYSYDNGEVVPE